MTTADEIAGSLGLEAQPSFARRRLNALGRFVVTQPLGTIGAIIIIVMILGSVFAGQLNTVDPKTSIREAGPLDAPNGDNYFGTDRSRRDVWSRVLYGGRPTLLIGFGAVAITMGAAIVLALAAGFLGGIVDVIISRLIEIIIAVPAILWLLMFTTAIDRSVQTLMFSVAFTFTPIAIRLFRGNVIQERSIAYVEAARVIGASGGRIMFRHILPNLAPLVIVAASITIPAAMLAEAGLTFLGLGLEPGTPSWAQDLGPSNRPYFRLAWWLVIFPGAALALAVLAFNFFGDSVRDVLDPRLRGSGLI
ncbi:MAG: ABC transporter permease [Dehalococcoidia bacterium]|nr:ABC transporter permease [Dehalococcoidia bacterium]MXY71525.1 ABC transporter permease [Dehalococcoidia bacterium]MYD28606.1 ABC transporter permease [Dehalococcoidia bacterium]